MTTYPLGRTALVLIDATNDFTSEGGKAWRGLRDVLHEVDTVANMKRVLDTARNSSRPSR